MQLMPKLMRAAAASSVSLGCSSYERRTRSAGVAYAPHSCHPPVPAQQTLGSQMSNKQQELLHRLHDHCSSIGYQWTHAHVSVKLRETAFKKPAPFKSSAQEVQLPMQSRIWFGTCLFHWGKVQNQKPVQQAFSLLLFIASSEILLTMEHENIAGNTKRSIHCNRSGFFPFSHDDPQGQDTKSRSWTHPGVVQIGAALHDVHEVLEAGAPHQVLLLVIPPLLDAAPQILAALPLGKPIQHVLLPRHPVPGQPRHVARSQRVWLRNI